MTNILFSQTTQNIPTSGIDIKDITTNSNTPSIDFFLEVFNNNSPQEIQKEAEATTRYENLKTTFKNNNNNSLDEVFNNCNKDIIKGGTIISNFGVRILKEEEVTDKNDLSYQKVKLRDDKSNTPKAFYKRIHEGIDINNQAANNAFNANNVDKENNLKNVSSFFKTADVFITKFGDLGNIIVLQHFTGNDGNKNYTGLFAIYAHLYSYNKDSNRSEYKSNFNNNLKYIYTIDNDKPQDISIGKYGRTGFDSANSVPDHLHLELYYQSEITSQLSIQSLSNIRSNKGLLDLSKISILQSITKLNSDSDINKYVDYESNVDQLSDIYAAQKETININKLQYYNQLITKSFNSYKKSHDSAASKSYISYFNTEKSNYWVRDFDIERLKKDTDFENVYKKFTISKFLSNNGDLFELDMSALKVRAIESLSDDIHANFYNMKKNENTPPPDPNDRLINEQSAFSMYIPINILKEQVVNKEYNDKVDSGIKQNAYYLKLNFNNEVLNLKFKVDFDTNSNNYTLSTNPFNINSIDLNSLYSIVKIDNAKGAETKLDTDKKEILALLDGLNYINEGKVKKDFFKLFFLSEETNILDIALIYDSENQSDSNRVKDSDITFSNSIIPTNTRIIGSTVGTDTNFYDLENNKYKLKIQDEGDTANQFNSVRIATKINTTGTTIYSSIPEEFFFHYDFFYSNISQPIFIISSFSDFPIVLSEEKSKLIFDKFFKFKTVFGDKSKERDRLWPFFEKLRKYNKNPVEGKDIINNYQLFEYKYNITYQISPRGEEVISQKTFDPNKINGIDNKKFTTSFKGSGHRLNGFEMRFCDRFLSIDLKDLYSYILENIINIDVYTIAD